MNELNYFISQYWPEILTSILSIVAIVISIKAWAKSRVVYGIERTTLKYVRGRSDDAVANQRLDEINQKLLSGKYTIITITSREDGDFEIILGKIKK